MSHVPGHAPPPPSGDEAEIRYFFIRRPVLAAVISIVIVLLGTFALLKLPVSRYPQITPPSVQISAVYPGATAEDVALAVAAPIEQQLSGLDGLLYYKSSNSSNGVMNLQVFFDISRDQDLAAVDVQNAIKVAEPQLPEEVRRQGVTIKKAQTDILLVASLSADDPRYDATYLANYAKLYVVDELKRLNGVGDAMVFGGLDFAMTIKLDPDRMTQLGLSVADVRDAVREQNATNPAGTLGREPAPVGTELTLPVTALGRLQTPEQFANIIIRARKDGSFVRVKDIGTVELTSQNLDLVGRLNGKPTANMLLYLRPGANQLEVKEVFVQRMTELAAGFPPGVTWSIPFDATPFVTASIEEVVKTLAEAMFLVTLVVFIFLQSWRATLIPVLAVPVSIIGTFLGLSALGYSVNVLTLFALVLAIGIVVDDAIVVIENVERIMDEEKVSAKIAADRAMRQVGGALVAIVLVLCAVFIPVAFLGGITGTMLRQFAVTLVVSVVLSGLVALTLTPALCALLLKETPHDTHNPFFRRFNNWFDKMTGGYTRSVRGVLARQRVWLAAFAVLVALTVVLFRRVPTAFIPTEDKGFFVVAIQLPDGASRQRTDVVVEQVENILRKEPSVRQFTALVGFNLLAGANQSNGATIFVLLKDWDERHAKENNLDAILGRVNGQLFGIRNALAFGFNFPEIPGLGATAGLELNLQARAGQDVPTFANQVRAVMADLSQLPQTPGAATTFRAEVPQVYLHVDREQAKAHGVKLGDLFATLQAMLSTLYINDFNLYGRTYRVQAEAEPEFRQTPADIGRLYVRAENDTMIPLSALTRTEFRAAPSVLGRFNGFTSAMVTAAAPPGVSSGQQLDAVEGLLRQKYEAEGIGFAYSGQSFQERASSGEAGLVFVLGLVLVFLVLAAQYESWTIPFAVIFGIPFGVLGAYLGIWMRDIPSDIYFQVALITVVGLAAKNAILIVEFATELRRQGMSLIDAAAEAARERFRPILMTSFAFILGVAPLTIAGGAGAASRHSLGTGVFAGMLTATVVGIFFIPLFFVVIQKIADRVSRRRAVAPVVAAVALAMLSTGCLAGPSYREPVLAPEAVSLGVKRMPDSLRVFYDSLALTADSGRRLPPAQPALTPDSADIAWLAILRDTTLVQLINVAMRENKDVLTAVARIKEYRAQLGVARGPLFPELRGTGAASTNQAVFGAFPPQSFDALVVRADLQWELDFWGRVRRGTQAARADLEVQEAGYRATLLTLISDVATAYLSLLELRQEEKIAERTLASRRATLALARDRFQSGVISALDVHQFESQVAVPAATLAQAQRLRSQREHELARLLGRLPFAIPSDQDLSTAVAAVSVPDSIPAALLSRRPDVRAAERAYSASISRIGVAQAARLPAVSITGYYGSQSNALDGLFRGNAEIYQLQGGVSVPIFTGGRLANQTRVAEARAEQARLQFENTVLGAFREANDALVAVRTARQQRIAQGSQVEALRQATELAELRYRGGVASYLEVLDAQRGLFSAELGLSQAQLLELGSAVQLFKALGGSWSE